MVLLLVMLTPPAGVKAAVFVILTVLAAFSSLRPGPVSLIFTVAFPACRNTIVIVVFLPFTFATQTIESFPALGATNENEKPPAFTIALSFAAFPDGLSTFDSAAFT